MEKEYAVKVTRTQVAYVTVTCEARLVEKRAKEKAEQLPDGRWETIKTETQTVSVLEPLED